jgi:hypothetical protein
MLRYNIISGYYDDFLVSAVKCAGILPILQEQPGFIPVEREEAICTEEIQKGG